MKNKKQDLTEGSVFPLISMFALPMLAGNLLQQLYNIADTWIVGRYIGADALAAVGSVYALMVFLTSILIGLCMGSGVVFSIGYGQKDFAAMERRIGTSFVGIGILAIMLMGLAGVFMMPLLHWMNIPNELLGMTRAYLKIILCGIPAVFLYNFFAAYLKSLGNSMVPLFFLAMSAVTNILLDFLFVLQFEWGVDGAAWATVLAQYLSAVTCTSYVLFRDIHGRNAFRKIQISREDVRILGRFSFYTCLQQSVMNLGILVVQGIVNSFGTAVMAAFATGVKIDSFAYMPAQEYANACSTFLAQNYGAGKKERIKKGIRCGIITSITYCTMVSGVLWFFAEELMRIFVSSNEGEIIGIGVQYLHIEGVFYIGIGCLFLWYGFYRAVGKPEMSLILTIVSLGTRVILAKISAVTSIGAVGIWWTIPIGWAFADLTGLWYYRKMKRNL